MYYLTFYLRLYGVGHMVKDHSDTNHGALAGTFRQRRLAIIYLFYNLFIL